MAKKHLSTITIPLQGYIAERKKKLCKKLVGVVKGDLPVPFQVAALRGEGILRLRFFDFLEKTGITNPQRQLDLWLVLVVDRGRIIDLIQRVGLLDLVARQNTALKDLQARSDFAEIAFLLYCGLLDDFSRQQKKNLLSLACEKFFEHHFLGLYPAKPVPPKKLTAVQLRQRVLAKLQKYWGFNVKLKESFSTDDDSVDFALRMQANGMAWLELLRISGKRLKATRNTAYRKLLQEIKEGRHRPPEKNSEDNK